jgi:hypothetical protein
MGNEGATSGVESAEKNSVKSLGGNLKESQKRKTELQGSDPWP